MGYPYKEARSIPIPTYMVLDQPTRVVINVDVSLILSPSYALYTSGNIMPLVLPAILHSSYMDKFYSFLYMIVVLMVLKNIQLVLRQPAVLGPERKPACAGLELRATAMVTDCCDLPLQ